jgi:hypothetical protein
MALGGLVGGAMIPRQEFKQTDVGMWENDDWTGLQGDSTALQVGRHTRTDGHDGATS